MEQQAHEYASGKAAAYAAKFAARGVVASAVDAVYLHAYGQFLLRARRANLEQFFAQHGRAEVAAALPA